MRNKNRKVSSKTIAAQTHTEKQGPELHGSKSCMAWGEKWTELGRLAMRLKTRKIPGLVFA